MISHFDDYNGELLELAIQLGDKLLPAFLTPPTGIPYGTVSTAASFHFDFSSKEDINLPLPLPLPLPLLHPFIGQSNARSSYK